MSWTELPLALVRGASLAAVLSMFGALIFGLVVVRMPRVVAASCAAAVVLTLLWLLVQTASTAADDGLWAICSASPTAAVGTLFGRLVLARAGLLVASMGLAVRGHRLATVAAAGLLGAAIVLQPWMGHAGAVGGQQGVWLVVSEGLHLLAAGVWLGGLVPLLIVLSHGPADARSAARANFGRIAFGCVLVLALTGLWQSSDLIGGIPGLVGTPYGRVALLKMVLLSILLGLTVAHRASSGRRAARLIALEGALGLAAVLGAGVLASQAPAIHQQPAWPFPVRLDLGALSDPGLAREAAAAVLACVGALVLGGVAPIWRRTRWAGLAAAGLLALLAAPHLGVLFTQAFPSTYYSSPTEFGDSGIVRGGRLFSDRCAACHGAEGRGDGPQVGALAVAPADLTADHLWAHTDGDLFWWVSNGVSDPRGRLSMPGFASLSSDARWDVIDYLHAHNAGVSMRSTGVWVRPPAMPQFDAICGDGRTIDLDDMRGKPMLIVAGEPPPADPATPGLTIIEVVRTRVARPSGGICVTAESDTWAALAILLGVSSDGLAGAQILVDRDGWLRLRSMPGLAGGWIGDPAALAASLRRIEADPIRLAASHHRH